MARLFLVTALVTALTVVASGGREEKPAPELLGVLPPVIHAGYPILLDVKYEGRRPPRVWIGPRRLSRSRVQPAESAQGSLSRRIWAWVPKRLEPGDHEVRIGTRAGMAKGSRFVQIADCEPVPPEPAGCGNIPDKGVRLDATGSGGYRKQFKLTNSADPEVVFNQTVFNIGDNEDAIFSMNIPLDPSDMHVGPVPTLFINVTDFGTPYLAWEIFGASVRVVEESSSRVGLCIDAVLDRSVGTQGPAQLTIHGHLVLQR